MITFQEALDLVNHKIECIQYPERPDGLYLPMRYILSLKGKKVRPVLTLLGCNLYRDDVAEAVSPALAWEIFHNFTLMHDDVMDKADVRRGLPTVHKKWDENTAILSGDAMLILAYQHMALTPENKLKCLLDLFSRTAAEICEGQQYDMEFEHRLDVTEKEYLEMIRLKTAVLLGASLKSGAIIGNAGDSDLQALYDFGIWLGLAFQIKDDLLDIYGESSVFGKKTGGDILCNKKTYFLVNALTLSDAKDHQELILWLQTSDNDDGKITAVTSLYNKLGLKEKAEEKMKDLYQKALDALSCVRVDETRKKVLLDFARELMGRNY